MNLRIILITGANGGLGQAIARAFLQESPNNVVWLGVRSNCEHADKLAQENLGRCFCVNLDVIAEADLLNIFAENLSTKVINLPAIDLPPGYRTVTAWMVGSAAVTV